MQVIVSNVRRMFEARGYVGLQEHNGPLSSHAFSLQSWYLAAFDGLRYVVAIACECNTPAMHAALERIRTTPPFGTETHVVLLTCEFETDDVDVELGEPRTIRACIPAHKCAAQERKLALHCKSALPQSNCAHVEVWRAHEFAHDWQSHELVPKHTRVTHDQDCLHALCARYGSTFRQCLPCMLQSDPAARYLHLRPGDIVRIDRYDHIAGNNAYYRRVVS